MNQLADGSSILSVVWRIDDWGVHPQSKEHASTLRAIAARLGQTIGYPGSPLDSWRQANGFVDVGIDFIVPAGWHEFDTKPVTIEGSLYLVVLVDHDVLGLPEEELFESAHEAAIRVLDSTARKRGWGRIAWGDEPTGALPAQRVPSPSPFDVDSFETLWRALEAVADQPNTGSHERCLRIARHLSTLTAREVGEFNSALPVLLHWLDRPWLCQSRVWDVGDDQEAAPLPLTDDTFLYFRCAIVLSGRAAYERAISASAPMAGQWDLGSGDLLTVGELALELGGLPDLRASSLPSYETGTNSAFWNENSR